MAIAARVLLVSLLSALGVTANAQTIEKAAAEVRFKLDEEGNLAVSPDPAAGGAPGDSWRPIADPRAERVWQNLGLVGWLACLCSGDADTASLTNARRFFELTGVDEETLVRMLGRLPAAEASPTERTRYVLAIRAAQDLGLMPALGPMLRAAESAADPGIRRAAAEGAAALREEPKPEAATVAVRPLDEVLARCPIEPQILAVVDQTRLPPRALHDLSRRLALASTRRACELAGGTVSTAMWAGASMLAEAPGILPYEFARRFGNHRIARTVFALRMDVEQRTIEAWAAFDGEFDVPAIAAGLEAAGLPCAQEGGRLTVVVARDLEMRVTRSTAEVSRLVDAELPAIAPAAPEFAGAPIRVRLRDVPNPAGGSWPVGALPAQVGISVPQAAGEPFVVDLRFATPALAARTAAQIGVLPSLVEQLVDAGELPESVKAAAAKLAVEQDGSRLRVQLVLPPIDDELITAIVKHLR